jgi:penicillin-binding protein 1A
MNEQKRRRRWPLRLIQWGFFAVLAGTLLATLAGAVVWLYLEPRLPSIAVLKDVQLQVPLRVYSRDGRLLGEFGEKRRIPLHLAEIPDPFIKAVLAAEDDRFFEHPGVDWQGLMRAAWHLLRTGEKGQGGSTITMQVARNFFLGREKTYLRKLNEIILAFEIEQSLTKNEILELYLNKIYLGHRAYGVGAAAQVYYGKTLDELSLAQVAMIAGLPKAPSRFNPIADPERGLARRNYVLRRLRELGFIDEASYRAAYQEPVTAELHGPSVEVEAPYVAEMARAYMVERFGDDAYTGGYVVYTTVDSRLQEAAKAALRNALIAYDRRHGYRGPEREVSVSEPGDPAQWTRLLGDLAPVGGLRAALVTRVEDKQAFAFLPGVGEVELPWEGIAWARTYRTENIIGPELKSAGEALKPGDVIRLRRVRQEDKVFWQLAQVPEVEGALVALSPADGAILALSGGFDFDRSKFNRAVQAERQPGSNFKPFVYSAALDSGLTPATIINDAPVVFDDPGLEAAWRPENYSGRVYGPTRLREALTKSRNLVSIRILRAVGVDKAINYVARLGFDTARLPRNLSLALGSGTVTPLELATGYAVFANGGFRVEPYFIDRVLNSSGEVVFEAAPARACSRCEAQEEAEPTGRMVPAAASKPLDTADDEAKRAPGDATPARLAPRVITPQNAWLMTSIMGDVIRRGTGRRALVLKRSDLAGKTGTTNDQRDTWFSGFNQQVVTTVWVGFDRLLPLGRGETGARAALPMWIDFMRVALEGVPELPRERPKGLVTVRIDPDSGQLATADNPRAIFETFRVGHVPHGTATAEAGQSAGASETVTEQLF